MKKIFFLLGIYTLPLFAQSPSIVIHNRPLAKVNDKTITLIDVMKHLDTELSTHDPKMYRDESIRFQYLNHNWKRGLEDLVEQELILSSYEEKKLFEISDGDVRKEMHARFGPNIATRLDELHLTHDEAKKMVENDLVVRQMLWYKAYSKAMQSITPEAIKIAYQAYLEQNPPKSTWKYQMLSIRGGNASELEKLALQAYESCLKENKTFEELASSLSSPTIQVKASKLMEVEDKSLSDQHKEVLSTLDKQQFSKPISQSSRNSDNVVRIFYLKDLEKEQPPAFEDIAENLKNVLMNRSAEMYKKQYIQKLKGQFGFSDEQQTLQLPKDYQPFSHQ